MPAAEARPSAVEVAYTTPVLRASVAPFHDQRATVDRLLRDCFGIGLTPARRYAQDGQITVAWADSQSWWIEHRSVADVEGLGFIDEIRTILSGAASVVDRTHGLVGLTLKAPKLGTILSDVFNLDLHSLSFEEGSCAVTSIAHSRVHIRWISRDELVLLNHRSYAGDLMSWIKTVRLPS